MSSSFQALTKAVVRHARRRLLGWLDQLRDFVGQDEPEIPYRLLTENSCDVITLADPQLKRLYVSPACLDVMGYTQEELVGRTPKNLLHPADADQVMAVYKTLTPQDPKASTSWRMLRPDGTYRWMETTYSRLVDGRIVSVVRDIQDRKEVEQQLEEALSRVVRLAMHDPLTDLANRRSFVQAIGEIPLTHAAGAILIIDLDGFKKVNDGFGHAVGDQVLVEVAERFRRAAGATALVARLGGDEFGVLLSGCGKLAATGIANAIVETALQPFEIGQLNIKIGACVGIALFPDHGEEIGALMRHADEAMYLAKYSGRSSFQVFGDSFAAKPISEVMEAVDLPGTLVQSMLGHDQSEWRSQENGTNPAMKRVLSSPLIEQGVPVVSDVALAPIQV